MLSALVFTMACMIKKIFDQQPAPAAEVEFGGVSLQISGSLGIRKGDRTGPRHVQIVVTLSES